MCFIRHRLKLIDYFWTVHKKYINLCLVISKTYCSFPWMSVSTGKSTTLPGRRHTKRSLKSWVGVTPKDFLDYFYWFLCPPPHEVRKGAIEFGTVCPSVFLSVPVPFPRCFSLCEKHHYTIKAGDTGATCTLVFFFFFIFQKSVSYQNKDFRENFMWHSSPLLSFI